jgi:hypothetical protein
MATGSSAADLTVARGPGDLTVACDSDDLTVARGPGAGDSHDSLLGCVERDVNALVDIEVDALDLDACRSELARIDVLGRRLAARRARLVGAIDRRVREAARAARATDGAHGRHLADRQGARSATDQLVQELGWSPSDARRAARTSRQAEAYPLLADAFSAGRLSERHLQLAADLLQHFEGDAARELEEDLARIAPTLDPVSFSKHCRRVLAERRHERAMFDEGVRRSRRSLRMTAGDDGMLHLSAHLAGIDAELVAAAIKGFRRPDTSSVAIRDRRTPEQVTADALVEICDVALGAAKAPRRHSERPHVVVTIDYQTLLADNGAVAVDELGTLPIGEVRRLLADAGVSRVLVDPAGVALEAGRRVRTVPAGLWRALRLRDGGCVADGCSIPAEWCQVAHLDQPYRLGGRLTRLNAALLCHLHHTRYDRSGWPISWESGRPVLRPPDREGGPAPELLAAERPALAHQASDRPASVHQASARPAPERRESADQASECRATYARGHPPGSDPPLVGVVTLPEAGGGRDVTHNRAKARRVAPSGPSPPTGGRVVRCRGVSRPARGRRRTHRRRR